MTDHNVRETLSMCDVAHIVSQGKVLISGTPEIIVQNTQVREVYLGEHFKF